jgi:hypothetical protein
MKRVEEQAEANAKAFVQVIKPEIDKIVSSTKRMFVSKQKALDYVMGLLKENEIFEITTYLFKLNKIISENEIISNDINNILSKNIENNNRFLNKYSFPTNFGIEVNKWIIYETENYVKNNKWHLKNNIYYLHLKYIPSVFNFFLYTFKNIIAKISSNYLLNSSFCLNVTELLIQKYIYNKVTIEEDNTDEKLKEDFLKFYILLNDEYKGFKIFFDNEISYELKYGEIFVIDMRFLFKFPSAK